MEGAYGYVMQGNISLHTEIRWENSSKDDVIWEELKYGSEKSK